MKIMMMITGMQSGGAERVMATLCNELSKKHQIKLVIMKSDASDYDISESVEISSGNIMDQSLIKSVQFAKKSIEEWKPDVVLSFMTKTNIIALLANMVAKKKSKIIIAERANPYNAKRIFRIIRSFLYPKAKGFVFQTYQAQDYYKNMVKCDSVVLKNPLNPDFNIKPYCGEYSKRIVSVGRLSEEKNHRLLIDAFSKIADKYPDYKVEIYGDGPLKGTLQSYICEKGMQEKVFLMGRKDHIIEHICDAELFVLPSNSEGMPNALLEAMALGMACIATDCPIGGSAVIIQNEQNGLLVPMQDVDSMVAAIDKMLSDKVFAARMREEAHKVTEDFNVAKVCAEWEAYLEKVSNHN